MWGLLCGEEIVATLSQQLSRLFEGRDTMNWALERFFEKRREEGRQEGLQEGRQEILDAIKKAYPEIDLSIIPANNGAEKDSDEKKN